MVGEPKLNQLTGALNNNSQWDADAHRVINVDNDGNVVDVNYPMPTNGDSVYCKDIWVEESDMHNFDGDPCDLFNNLHSQIKDITGNDPKELFIHFNRTIISNAIGLGNTGTGNFSNVKIEIVNSGGILTTVVDESLSPTKYTSRTFQLPITAGFNALKITFNTTDHIHLTNCVILKAISVIARLQAKKPDGTVTDIDATTGGNLKVAIEEFDDEANPIRKDIEAKGKIAIGTTPTEILFTGVTKGILITADIDNSGLLFVGKSDVTSAGLNSITFLQPGDVLEIPYDDSDNALYVVSDTASQNVWIGGLL